MGGLNSADGGYFDIVIGNPPYVFTRDVDFGLDFKRYVQDAYFSRLAKDNISIKTKANQSGKINLFALFILNGKNLLNNNGTLNFIIPNNLLRGTVFDTIRYDILMKNGVISIVDLGAGIFEKVTASTIIFHIGKKQEETPIKIITDIKSLLQKEYNFTLINQANFLKNTSYTFNIMLNEEQIILSNKIKESKTLFGNYCVDIIEGIVAHKHLILEEKSDKTHELLEGKDIKRFYVIKASNHIIWNLDEIHRKRPDYLWKEPIKIIMQRISGGKMPLVAALDKQKRKTFASINNIVLKDEYKNYYQFFVALLNSKLLNWYYANNFSNNSNLTVNISKTFLETLPIATPTEKYLQAFIKIVDIIEEEYDDSKHSSYCNELDYMTYKLYNLTYEEVKIIEPNFSLSEKEYNEFTI